MVLLCAPTSCGSISEGHSGIVSTKPTAESGYVRIRWFPVDGAQGYVVRGEGVSGETVFAEPVQPVGCTQRALDGYTSGLCAYDIRLRPAEQAVSLRVTAFNARGEGQASERVVYP
jgi:hypothetical protein